MENGVTSATTSPTITAGDHNSSSSASAAVAAVISTAAATSVAAARATYKQLPDEDVDWELKRKQQQQQQLKSSDKEEVRSNGDSNKSDNKGDSKEEQQKKENNTTSNKGVLEPEEMMGKEKLRDKEGAEEGEAERMLKETVKVSVIPAPKLMNAEVKFIPENGDAKINIGESAKQILSGMGKTELMKYANDPFWIRLRWFLFVAFWLLWAAMLAGAIAIIVMAPKCKLEARKWWEKSAMVKLDEKDVPEYKLKSLDGYLDGLKEQGVRDVALGAVFKREKPGEILDFKSIDPSIGTIIDFESFANHAKSNEQRVILDVDPNHSSVGHSWFLESVKRTEPYASYYVWADGIKSPDGSLNPPNNWVSFGGGSAWTFNEDRKQYYLHQFDPARADFNYANPAVVDAFSDILTHWLNLGVGGFRLANTRFLVEDPGLANDTLTDISNRGKYESLLHVHTRDHMSNSLVLRKWRDVVMNVTNGEGLFTLSDEVDKALLQAHNARNKLIDLPQSMDFLAREDVSATTAVALNKSISDLLAFNSWPSFDLNNERIGLRKRVSVEVADSLVLMTMLLPATPILKISDTTSAQKAFAKLSKAREDETFLYGETKMDVLNKTVFVYTRFKSGNPGYLVAYNNANDVTTVDVSQVPHVSEEVDVFTYSPNFDENLVKNKQLPSKELQLSPKSTLVVKFIHKT